MTSALTLALSLVWKALATAGVVILAGRLAQRAGPVLTAVIVSVPINAGPGFFFISLSTDAAFISRAVIYALATTGPVLIFTAVFIRVARDLGFHTALAAAFAAWAVAAIPISRLEIDLMGAFVCVALGALVAFRVRAPAMTASTVSSVAGWRYLLLRGAVAGGTVAVTATAAPFLGTEVSGLLMSLPVTLGSSAWMLNGHYGKDFVAATLKAAQKSLSVFLAYGIALHVLAGPLSGPVACVVAFALSIVAAGLYAAVVRHLARRRL